MKRNRKDRQKKRSRNRLFNLVILILIVICLIFIFNKSIRNSILAYNTAKYQVTNVSKKEISKNQEAKTNYDFSKIKAVSTTTVLKNQAKAQKLPVIGGIAIPELKMNLPIFKGVENTALTYGAGTMKENQEMGQGNYALASHHVFGMTGASKLLFSPLAKAKKGMTIYLTDKQYVYTYTISSVETVDPSAVYVIDDEPGKTQVTLVTCDDLAATERIIVKGNYQSKIPYNKKSQDMKKAFDMTYNQFQS